MAKTLGWRIFPFLLFIIYSAPALSEGFKVYTEDFHDQIQFWVENDSTQDVPAKSFKRGVSTLVFLFSEEGVLLPFRDWLNPKERSYYTGSFKLFYQKSKLPKTSAFIFSKDLRQFDMDPMKTDHNSISGRFYLLGWVNLLNNSPLPFYLGTYLLDVKDTRVIRCSQIKNSFLPDSVLKSSQAELNKIMSEERFDQGPKSNLK